MKRKLLFAIAAFLCSITTWAQTNVTSTLLNNPSFELSAAGTNLTEVQKASNATLTMYGWTQNLNGNGYNNTEIVDNSTKGSNSNHSSAIAAADGSYHLFFRKSWNNNSTADVVFTSNTASYTPGSYTITYSYILEEGTSSGNTSTGSYMVLKAMEGTTAVATSDQVKAKNWGTSSYSNTWATATMTFSLTETKTLALELVLTPRGGNKTEIHIDNFVIMQSPFATDTDYGNLGAAISAVENKTLGFDAGEYAPYNHEDQLNAYAQAKDIDPSANNSQVAVQALTNRMNATWTANTSEVNAIWDPSFEHDYSGLTGNVQPIGWYREKGTTGDGYNVRYMGGSNAGLAATSSSKALFTKFQGYYGWQDGYTMPLNASTYYTIGFIYGGWGDCKKDGYVQMEDPHGTAITPLPSNTLPLDGVDADSNTESWKTYSGIFKTNDAGDYVLALLKTGTSQQSQYVYGDFVLKQTTVAEATTYYNTVKTAVEGDYDDSANGDSEKTAFKDALDADVSGYTVAELMEAAANLPTLRDAFVAATPKYDLYYAEKANAERISADITSSISDPTTAAEAETAFQAILVGEYTYVKNNFNSNAAVKYGMTIDQWTGTATSGGNADTPQTKSNEKWGNDATTYYEQGANGWSSNNWTLNYSITKTLPVGSYVLKIAARASTGTTATLKATVDGTDYYEDLPNFGSTGKGITTTGVASFDDADDFANSDNGYGWQWRYLFFNVATEGDVTLQIDASADSQQQWCSFGDVALISNVNLSALTTAYLGFTMQTLGFQKDEYAPYANAELLKAYADAHDILYEVTEAEDQAQVDDLASTLNAAAWVQNADDVDAIYNGTFSSSEDWGLTGWTRTNSWGQQRDDLGAQSSNGYGYYNQSGSLQYGNNGVYTMPLAGSQLYKLTFKYGAWDNWTTPTISVLKAEDGLAATALAATNTNYKTSMLSQTMYFKTGAAGNYILDMGANYNIVWSDVSLVKADESELTMSSGNLANPTFFQELTIGGRTFSSEKWNTLCVPFAFDKDDFAEVKELSSITVNGENVSMAFADASTIVAGKPYLVKAKNNGDPLTATNVAVGAGVQESSAENGGYTVNYVGTYDGVALTDANSNAWVVSANKLWNVNSNVTVGAYRAYFTVTAPSPVKSLSFDVDGEVTAISGLANDEKANEVYDLSGRRIQKPVRGLYIVNGKKVVIK